MQTYFSYTNNYAKGIIPNNDLNRQHLGLLGSRAIVFPKLTYDVKATYINQTINGVSCTGEENSLVFDAAHQMPRSEKTQRRQELPGSQQCGYIWTNELALYPQLHLPEPLVLDAEQTFISEDRQRVVGYFSLKYAVTPWLSLRGSANLDRTDDELDQQYQQGTLLWNTNAGGSFATTGLVSEQRWFDASVDGHNNIAKDLRLEYQVGTIRQDITYSEKDAGSNGLNVTNKFSLNFASNPAIGQSGSESLRRSRSRSRQTGLEERHFSRWDPARRLGLPTSKTLSLVATSSVTSRP